MGRLQQLRNSRPQQHTARTISRGSGNIIVIFYLTMLNSLKYIWKKYFDRHPLRLIMLVMALSLLAIIFRRPSVMTSPQLWGEDGKYFYADAYGKGLISLTATYANLQQFFLRLVSLLSTLINVRFVPLFFSLVSTSALLLPIFVMWSDENILFGALKRHYLVILTFLYLMMYPHWETYGNLANTGWYLAIAAALVLARPIKSSKKWAWMDLPLLTVSGLTGPYSIVMILPAAYAYLKTKDKLVLLKLLIVISCAIVQLGVLATHPNPIREGRRSQIYTIVHYYKEPIQITGMRFMAIPLLSEKVISGDLARSDQVLALGILVLIIMTIALIKAPLSLKIFLLFCFGIYGASLLRSFGSPLADYWFALLTTKLGARYFVIPLFGWFTALIFLMNYPGNSIIRNLSKTLIFLFLITTVLSYRFSPVQDRQFKAHAQVFKQIPAGSIYCFPENPDGWFMCLTKKH